MAASFSIKNPNLKSQSCYPHQAQEGINLYLFTSFHSVACFVWKPAHLEFHSYDGAWQRLRNAFVEKYILTVLRHLQIRNTACVDPSFSRIESATNTQSFPLNSSKFVFAMIYQPTSSATRNMKSRLAINFEWWSNALPLGRKRRQMPRVCLRGMLKLRFDSYIKV